MIIFKRYLFLNNIQYFFLLNFIINFIILLFKYELKKKTNIITFIVLNLFDI